MGKFLELIISGISLGSVYALLALGFVVVFKATEVVNFAGAGFLMIAVYSAAQARTKWNLPFPLAVVFGIIVGAGISLAVERVVIRRLGSQKLIAVSIATLGIDVILQTEVIRRIGPLILTLGDPWGADVVGLGGITIPVSRIAAVSVAGLLIFGFFVWFKRSEWGTAVRAAAADPETALLMGVSLSRVSMMTWAFAGALAAVAGVFLVAFPSPGLYPTTSAIAFRAFPAAIIGGLDSPGGAIAGGLMVGVAESLTQGYQNELPFLGAGFYTVMPYVLMIGVLMWRPSGLFGTHEVSRA